MRSTDPALLPVKFAAPMIPVKKCEDRGVARCFLLVPVSDANFASHGLGKRKSKYACYYS